MPEDLVSMIDETHEQTLESWVESANAADGDFPIQNLPFGRFRARGAADEWRLGVAIGDSILDLVEAGLIEKRESGAVFGWPRTRRVALRKALSRGLRRGGSARPDWAEALTPMGEAELALPCEIRGYTDFYTGIHHATAVGRLFRPDNPLLPNYKWVPIGYHGRTSSILPSGRAILRPRGQVMPAGADRPVVEPSRRLDYELELGIVIGPGNALGQPIPIDQAEDHIVGLTLLNDWSARDLQAFEYQPLGPFLAKNFATTLSPWVVTLEALAPFRRPFERAPTEPQPLPYLDGPWNRAHGQVAIGLEVFIDTERMRAQGMPAVRLSRSSALDAYWTMAQLVAHHTVNGCNLQTGDLLGTGTLSGPDEGQGGSLLELSRGGRQPLVLPGGESRSFLEDGDCVSFAASCTAPGFRRIGFGSCTGVIVGQTGSAS
ncbi:MAG: fumarylacetoacetase [Gammaproteobacteria bacterium]|nr:fumarylacetoacetase [Gammaproteobacteria bacterium]